MESPSPKNAAGHWNVMSRGPAKDVDEVTSLEEPDYFTVFNRMRIDPDYLYSNSGQRDFTTAP